MAGTCTINGSFEIPEYGAEGHFLTYESPDAFTVGSVVVISDAYSGLQPFVGQVTVQDISAQKLTVVTLSAGTGNVNYTFGDGTTVTFGNPVTSWTAGPGLRQYQLNVIWPTDPSIVPPDVSWGPATGDGSTDSAPAINYAICMANTGDGGGLVMLPAGKFVCNSPIMLSGVGVHLWGVGKDATIIAQGMPAASETNPAVIEVTGKHNSIQHLTVQGLSEKTGGNPGPITVLPVEPTDPNLGYGWGILCAGVEETHIEDVRVTACFGGVAAICYDTIRGSEIEVDGVEGNYGYYAQGPEGSTSSANMAISGSAIATDTITVTLTSDLGDVFATTYTLVSGDSDLTVLATHLAAAINASGAVIGQLAFLRTVTSLASELLFTALYGGLQGNAFTYSASATGAIVVPDEVITFAGGTAESSNDFMLLRCGCKAADDNSNVVEAFHCDGAVSAFTTILCAAEKGCAYHTRVAIVNAGEYSNPPTYVQVQTAQSDNSKTAAYSFENGRGCRLIASRSGATAGPSVYIGASLGADTRILDCDFGDAELGIDIHTGSVVVEGCSISNSKSGIMLESSVAGQVSLIGNQLGFAGDSGQPIGIDLSLLSAGTDWITVIGNTLATGTVKLASTPVTFGQHSRISNNPGYNPVDPASRQPSFPSGNATAEVQNPYSCDAMVAVYPNTATGTTTTITTVKLRAPGGSPFTYLSGSFGGTTPIYVLVPCGSKISFTLTDYGHAAWFWIPT